VIAVGEKHMAAHFAGQFGVGLLHLGLDERMAGLPHDGLAAARGDIVIHELRAFHFADESGARLARQDFTSVKNHQLVAPEDGAALVDGANAVGVAIEGNTKVGFGFEYAGDQRFEIARDGGSG